MKDGMTTADIYGQAFALLRKRHGPTAVKYSIRRAMLELGPDGFPFEKFVARISSYSAMKRDDQTLKAIVSSMKSTWWMESTTVRLIHNPSAESQAVWPLSVLIFKDRRSMICLRNMRLPYHSGQFQQ